MCAHILGRAIWHEARPDQAVRQQVRYPVGVLHIGLAARQVLDMRGVRQHQLEITVGQDVPNGFPVDTGRFHRNVRTLVLGEPPRQTDQVCRCRREGANILHDLAIHYDPKARGYRLLMHIETTAPGI